MQDIKNYFCSNPDCKSYGLQGAGNLVKAGTYTQKNSKEKKQLLKCTACGIRFSETQNALFAGYHYDEQTIQSIILGIASGSGIRATARQLGISKDRVNTIVVRALAYADLTFSNLLRSLHMKEDQLNELWLFIQNMSRRKRH
jgi:transposase-like protein